MISVPIFPAAPEQSRPTLPLREQKHDRGEVLAAHHHSTCTLHAPREQQSSSCARATSNSAPCVFLALPLVFITYDLYRNFPVNSFFLFVTLMSRRGAPAPDRKEFFDLNAGAANSPSIPPADDSRSARAFQHQRRKVKDAAQATSSPARSSPRPAGALAETVPKGSPAKGSRPREPAVAGTAVPAPRGSTLK